MLGFAMDEDEVLKIREEINDNNFSQIAQQCEKDDNSHSHKMSIKTLIINIVADLCPHGMLPLAFGFAQGYFYNNKYYYK